MLPVQKKNHPFEQSRISVKKINAAIQMADVIRLKETAVVLLANVYPFGKNSIQLFKWLLLSIHTKLMSRLIDRQCLMRFRLMGISCGPVQITFFYHYNDSLFAYLELKPAVFFSLICFSRPFFT